MYLSHLGVQKFNRKLTRLPTEMARFLAVAAVAFA
jgi:hypothetical protein